MVEDPVFRPLPRACPAAERGKRTRWRTAGRRRPAPTPFRAGSRIRLLVTTPGRDSALWPCENPDYGDATVRLRVARTPAMPSRLLLPVVEGIPVPTGSPSCPSLRGQVCREYVEIENPSQPKPAR